MSEQGMGTSNERVGSTGSGQVGTHGTRDTGPADPDAATDAPDAAPEQSVGGEDPHPDSPIPPVSGYNSRDDRSEDHPFESRGPAASEGGT